MAAPVDLTSLLETTLDMLHPESCIITHHYSIEASFEYLLNLRNSMQTHAKHNFLCIESISMKIKCLFFFSELSTLLDILIWIASLISSQACRWMVLWKTWVRRCEKTITWMRKLDLSISKKWSLSWTWIYFLPESNIGKLIVASDEFPFGVFSGANC